MQHVRDLVIVVAVGRNGAIGKQGKVPWRIPEDMRHFKRSTLGHAVIMGRKTWDSIGKPLVDRRNIVVSRNRDLKLDGAEVVSSLDDAIALARTNDDAPRVIGGGEIYRQALPYTQQILLTEVDRDVEADAFFVFDRGEFHETDRKKGEEPDVTYITLVRSL